MGGVGKGWIIRAISFKNLIVTFHCLVEIAGLPVEVAKLQGGIAYRVTPRGGALITLCEIKRQASILRRFIKIALTSVNNCESDIRPADVIRTAGFIGSSQRLF